MDPRLRGDDVGWGEPSLVAEQRHDPRLIGAGDAAVHAGAVEAPAAAAFAVDADQPADPAHASDLADHTLAGFAQRLVREAVSPVTMDMLKLEGRLFADLMTQPETQALLKGVANQHRAERGG